VIFTVALLVAAIGAGALGAILWGLAGESLRRARRQADALSAELAVTRDRLASEAGRAEDAEAALRRVQEGAVSSSDAARALAEVESARRANDEFLAVLSHELRAPLQGVLGWVTLLREGRVDPTQQARALQAIERSTRLQTALINELLDASRMIRGQLAVESHPIDLAVVAREAIDHARPAAEARGITLDVGVADCGVTLGDPERLKQVLGTLLSNAIKFTPRGGTIAIRCESDDDQVWLTIRDTGEGIAPEFLPHVFEGFRQADSSSSRRHGGLGLGLAIARRLVELHGGRIVAASPGVGCGASFTIRLPRRATEEHPTAPPAADPRGAALNGRRVWVVEDDADAREAIVLALSLEGAQVESAGSAADAIRLIDGGFPDAVVSDLAMPGADGYALLAMLRARGIDAPVIAVTGFATPEDRRRALAAGFRAHIPKPVDVDGLLRTVARVVAAGDR
jgi:signal transduction histidine kinase/CheY-like chemotaxis protein